MQHSIGAIDNAANSLQWGLLEGFDYFYPDIKVITQPCIGSFPLKYKRIYFKRSNFSHKAGTIDYCLGFLNISLIKHFSKYQSLQKILKKTTITEEETTIIIYAIHSPYLKAAVKLKESNDKIRICQIVPDLPQFMSGSRNPIYRLLKSIDYIFINKYLRKIDSFVLLSDIMVKKISILNRPWIRVEGIFHSNINLDIPAKKEINKTILYTGNIGERFGIINLLDAFDSIKELNYRLWICGEGDCRTEIETRAKKDTRIKYFGQQPRGKVLNMQKTATALVNPRTSENEYTKYSFPSKIMEYMASGTPCIMYKLQGIPEEYFDYCFVVRNENREGLKEMIMTVCEKDQAELNEFGKRASQFIFENKTPIAQVRKIYDMIKDFHVKP